MKPPLRSCTRRQSSPAVLSVTGSTPRWKFGRVSHLEEHVLAHNRIVLSQGYSPRVRLRVLLPGVEVPRVGLAKQLHFQALRLRAQGTPAHSEKTGRCPNGSAREQPARHGTARVATTLEYVVMTPPIFLPSITEPPLTSPPTPANR